MPDAPTQETALAVVNPNEAAELRAALEAERRRADAAEARASDNSRRLAQSESGRLVAQEQTVDQAIIALNSEISGYEAEIADLQAEGKFPEAASAYKKMSLAASRLTQNEALKQQIAQHRETAARVPADPVEAFLASRDFTDSEKRWIRQNPRYATDQDFNALINRAHDEAVRDRNLARGSAEYFRYLDERAGGRVPQVAAQVAPPNPAPATAASTAEEPAAQTADSSPYSDTGEGEEDEIVIASDPPANQETPVTPTPVPGERPPQPQARAAGPGSMASVSVAARPSRSRPGSPGQAQTMTRLTPDMADTALRLARDLAPPEVLSGGDAQIYKWYRDLYMLPSVQRRREVA